MDYQPSTNLNHLISFQLGTELRRASQKPRVHYHSVAQLFPKRSSITLSIWWGVWELYNCKVQYISVTHFIIWDMHKLLIRYFQNPVPPMFDMKSVGRTWELPSCRLHYISVTHLMDASSQTCIWIRYLHGHLPPCLSLILSWEWRSIGRASIKVKVHDSFEDQTGAFLNHAYWDICLYCILCKSLKKALTTSP